MRVDDAERAIAELVADRHQLPAGAATAMLDDALDRGEASPYYEVVKPVALEVLDPLLTTIRVFMTWIRPALRAIEQDRE